MPVPRKEHYVEIIVTCRHPSVTSQMKAYAEEKLRKMTRIFDRLTSATVVLDMDGAQPCAEASVHAPRGATLVSRVSAADMFSALDTMEKRLEGQLRKLKERIRNRRPEVNRQPVN
jgi:ribosomal subunit interface protein